MIVVDLCKQLSLDGDPKTINQIDFSRNLDEPGNIIVFFITEEAKETVLDF